MDKNNFPENFRSKTMQRLTAVLVAVVFVLGTAVIPAEIYGTETDVPETEAVMSEAAETEAAETEFAEPADDAEEPADETADETSGEETASQETDLSDLVIVRDENGNEIDLEDLDESEYDGFLYSLTEDASKSEIKEMEAAASDLEGDQEVTEVVDNEVYAADSLETIEEVASEDIIEYIEPNYMLKLMGPNDPLYPTDGWYLNKTYVPYVWERGVFGSGAVVAVLDTGVNMKHEDLANTRFVSPYNEINKNTNVSDDLGHGTAVAGIIAAGYNNKKGMTGIMPKAGIMPVKVIGSNGYGNAEQVIAGIDYAVNKHADVINLSMATTNNAKHLEEACQRAVSSGVIVIAAAGNEADEGNPTEYPAAYKGVVSVGSVNINEEWSSFSNYNNQVTVVAFGEGIKVPTGASQYELWKGTSFSAPQVAALAAMAKSTNKVSPAEFKNLLETTSKDLGAPGYDNYYGYGLIDFEKALCTITKNVYYFRVNLSATLYDYNGSPKRPSVTSVSGGGKTLRKGTDYQVASAASGTAVGTYKVTVKGINDYTGTKTVTYKIRPPLVKSIKSPKGYKGKIKVRWSGLSKKQKAKYKKAITGYQVRVSTSSKFTSSKYVKVKGIKKTSATVKKLKKKKTYYVQYRTYKTVGSATYYSKWSKTKKVKTK